MIDRDRLMNLLGSEAMVERFVATFKKEAVQLCTELQRSQQARDFDAMSVAAHSLKSHLNYVGNSALAEKAEQIELEAEKGALSLEGGENLRALMGAFKD